MSSPSRSFSADESTVLIDPQRLLIGAVVVMTLYLGSRTEHVRGLLSTETAAAAGKVSMWIAPHSQ